MSSPYICVGGIGGSGTRVIAMILSSIGINMGNDLNEAFDNLTFTLLFKRQNISDDEIDKLLILYEKSFTNNTFNKKEIEYIYSLTNKHRPGHKKEWLTKRANNLINKTKEFECWTFEKDILDDIKVQNKFKLLTKNSIELNNVWGGKNQIHTLS